MAEAVQVVPLEERVLNIQLNGMTKGVPALHKNWVSKDRTFCRYIHHPVPENGVFALGAKETWLELVHFLQQDLRWLLTRPYHKFWSQMVFTEEPMELLTSFLQEAPPFYEKHLFPQDEAMTTALNETERLVFLVFLRLSKQRESGTHFISPAKQGDLWYSHYLFTVPIMFDICLLYGMSNPELTGHMIATVIEIQPKYLNDFNDTLPYLIQVCDIVSQNFTAEGYDSLPAKISQKRPQTSSEIRDLVVHFYDMVKTLNIFLEVYPKGGGLLTPLATKLSDVYSNILPQMMRTVREVEDEMLKQWRVGELLGDCRLLILRVVKQLLGFLLTSAMEDAQHSQRHVEAYLMVLSELLADSAFIKDLHCFYPVDVDMDLVTQIFPDVDPVKVDYIMEALACAMDLPLPSRTAPNVKENNFVNYPSTSNASTSSAGKPEVSGVELASLISQVKDILPHLGDGFIETCLKYYQFDTERVVAAVLESTLPPKLEEQSWDKPRDTPLKESERLNIFDHDEFDVMSRDYVDTTRIHKGKQKSKYKNVEQLLEDKSELADIRDRYTALGIVEDGFEYDDEYDDTYEGVDVSVTEADEEKERRPFVVPRVLRTREDREVDVEEVETEQVQEKAEKRDWFVPNPAELRAKAEQRRGEPHKGRDVVGKPKGQGQEQDVQANRNFKGAHKSSRANHNRRNQASRKRNQGMIPS